MLGNHYPKQGDLIWIDAEPHAGHEYGGHHPEEINIRRPMLVMSSAIYNERTGMIVGFPITSKRLPTGFVFAIKITTSQITGHAIITNLLGYDFDARNGKIITSVDKATLQQSLNAVKDIFDIL